MLVIVGNQFFRTEAISGGILWYTPHISVVDECALIALGDLHLIFRGAEADAVRDLIRFGTTGLKVHRIEGLGETVILTPPGPGRPSSKGFHFPNHNG